MTPVTDAYALDNGRAGAASMLDCLSAILDQSTVQLLTPLVPAGGPCLELGAGNGGAAGWPTDGVAPTGRVVATDLSTDRVRTEVRTDPRLVLLTQDLRTDPLPAGRFDVVHSRLLLALLADRD